MPSIQAFCTSGSQEGLKSGYFSKTLEIIVSFISNLSCFCGAVCLVAVASDFFLLDSPCLLASIYADSSIPASWHACIKKSWHLLRTPSLIPKDLNASLN